ncbi:MAG: acyl carrier protein [Desulfovibrionales bacterium]|nr:acyl carrier protein [Desulfovibrionales bacterium]
MNDSELTQRADNALAEEFEIDVERFTPETHFYDDLKLDSLDAVDMVVVLEQEFGIKIGKDPEIMTIRTVGDMHAYILAKKAQMTR